MSTRATILVNYKAGNTIQLYHHTDGYPEYMGKMLETFCSAAYFLAGDNDTNFYNLLKMEKHFEIEQKGTRHGDIEYIQYVTLTEEGYEVSYTELNPLFNKVYEIKDDEKFEAERLKLFDQILNAKKGQKIYCQKLPARKGGAIRGKK